MDCWAVLQLADDADERTIKRTYARLLKSCRPDDDAKGFQRLREAYEQALHIARWRAEQEDEAVEVIDAPVAELADGNPHEYAQFDDTRLVSPALFDLPPEQTRAQALINGLGAHTLDERWEQAQHQLCADAFQAALLRHCFDAPGERAAIAAWAVQHLEWLTPWQRVAMSPWRASPNPRSRRSGPNGCKPWPKVNLNT